MPFSLRQIALEKLLGCVLELASSFQERDTQKLRPEKEKEKKKKRVKDLHNNTEQHTESVMLKGCSTAGKSKSAKRIREANSNEISRTSKTNNRRMVAEWEWGFPLWYKQK